MAVAALQTLALPMAGIGGNRNQRKHLRLCLACALQHLRSQSRIVVPVFHHFHTVDSHRSWENSKALTGHQHGANSIRPLHRRWKVDSARIEGDNAAEKPPTDIDVFRRCTPMLAKRLQTHFYAVMCRTLLYHAFVSQLANIRLASAKLEFCGAITLNHVSISASWLENICECGHRWHCQRPS